MFVDALLLSSEPRCAALKPQFPAKKERKKEKERRSAAGFSPADMLISKPMRGEAPTRLRETVAERTKKGG